MIIFDLDDTLYRERDFVESGFRVVAEYLQEKFGWCSSEIYARLISILESDGRGSVFNRLLSDYGRYTKTLTLECVRVYRQHNPEIYLNETAHFLLTHLDNPLYLVTDGHKLVQQNKINALNLLPLFAKVFITHRFGLSAAKPSLHCFELIRRRHNCGWSDLAYIGDNPEKDFVNLTPLGVQTVRVLTGEYSNIKPEKEYEALHIVDNLSCLESCLPGLCWK